jgi:hypothetical protein
VHRIDALPAGITYVDTWAGQPNALACASLSGTIRAEVETLSSKFFAAGSPITVYTSALNRQKGDFRE